jgi:hypothetical protein
MEKPFGIIMVLLILLSPISVLLSAETFAQVAQNCEQCGMNVAADLQAHFRIVDGAGVVHYACCPMCSLKLCTKYDKLSITSNCDWYGPNSPINISTSQFGREASVNPTSILIIAGGGCTKNRIVSNQVAASALLANNGTSDYLPAVARFVNGVSGAVIIILANATIMTFSQALLQAGGGTPSPSPSSPPDQACEQCGMTVASDTQAHFKISDSAGKTHYACCIKCAIKILAKVNTLTIITNCDWFGPNFPITVTASDDLSTVTVNPSTARIIDGGCTKNRVVYDQTAANLLLANNGSSRYLIASQNTIVAANATVMSLEQAVRTFGVAPTSSPSPASSPMPTNTPVASPTPTITPMPSQYPTSTPTSSNSPVLPTIAPTLTPNPTTSTSPQSTATPSVQVQLCEACGMDATADAQVRYKVTDGNGNIHYVECFMCAINLINDYEQIQIETCCDWYGPNYPITIDSSQYGKSVTITPSSATYLNGGSCVINRVAYNQTAANALLANGYSQYTLTEQQYALPESAATLTVKEQAAKIAQIDSQKETQGASSTIFLIAALIGAGVIMGSIVAFKKIKN